MAARIPLPAPMPDAGLLVLRLALAVVLLFHGIYKLQNGIDWMAGPLGAYHLPLAVGYGAYIAELVAPVMLIAGVWTRLAALVIAGDMAMAVVLVLKDQLFTIKQAGGGWSIEIEAMIFFAALTLFFTGGGKYSALKD